MNEPSTQNHTLRGVLCTTIGGVCWGFSGTCGQYLFSTTDISTLWLTCIRLLTAGTLMLLLALRSHRRRILELLRSPRDLAGVAVFGVFGLAMCQLSYMTAISYSNAATTTVLQNLNLVFIMLLSCLRTRRRPNRAEGVSLALALAGTYILATGGDPRHMVLSGRGLFWGIATAVAVTIYTLLPRRLLPKWGQEVVTGCGMLIGGVVLNLAARSWTLYVPIPGRAWLAIGAIVVLGTVVSFTLFMRGLQDVGAVKSSMLASTEPVSATVFSAVWLGTTFSAPDLIGFACIIATIFLLAKSE